MLAQTWLGDDLEETRISRPCRELFAYRRTPGGGKPVEAAVAAARGRQVVVGLYATFGQVRPCAPRQARLQPIDKKGVAR